MFLVPVAGHNGAIAGYLQIETITKMPRGHKRPGLAVINRSNSLQRSLHDYFGFDGTRKERCLSVTGRMLESARNVGVAVGR